jgi:hypothetical protein
VQPEPPTAQATASRAGQMGGDVAKASQVVVVIEQGFAYVLLTSYAIEEVIPAEALWRGGSAAPVSGESSRDLTRVSGGPEAWGRPRIEWLDLQNLGATVFALDDAVEGPKWHGLHSSLGGMVQLPTNALSTLTGAAPTGQV